MRFIGIRKIIYIISLAIIIPGLVSMFWPGRPALNYGLDFKGGSMMDLKFQKAVSANDIRSVLSEDAFKLDKEAVIQKSGDNQYLIRTKELKQEENQNLLKEFKNKFGKLEVLRNDKVGASFSDELKWKALMCVALACIFMLIYIWVRFEFKFGVSAVLALIHDVLIVVGLFSLFQIEVDSSFVAAILTILGYSIMDTIVVFDRIRENMALRRKEPLDTIVDKSILQTLNRSINTVLTVVFTLIALLIFGGVTLKTFVLALLIGVLSGCYSSIFVASPIWYDLKMMEEN
ncbi:MAG: protein translocase subunit SecF [Candidatus Saccharibacteria bacterium]